MSRRAPRPRGDDTTDSVDPPSGRAEPAAIEPPVVAAATLLDLLAELPDAVTVGFEPTVEHLDVHIRPLPEDDRAAAAGLFTLVVPAEWTAVGAVVTGRARDLGTGALVGADAAARIVVTRDGEIASELSVDGIVTTAPDAPSGGAPGPAHTAEGVLVDALHRMLGLPSPGEAPSLATLVLSVWLSEILRVAVDGRTVPWTDAIDLHPGDPGSSRVTPSVETLVEATARASHELDWGRMRRRAARGAFRPADLSPLEARWMDDTMFGRWVVSSFPETDVVVELLRETGSTETAEGIDAVRRGVLALLRDPAPR
jgi:hypothetical protein